MENGKFNEARQTNYVVAIVVTLVFLIAGILSLYYVGLKSRQEAMHHIDKAVQQSRFNIDEHISEQFQTVDTGRVLAEEREWLADDAPFARMVERLLSNNSYTRAGIVSPEGEALWADRDGTRGRANLSEEVHIQKALAGENAISETRWDEAYGTYVNDYVIPTYYQNGALSGAIFVTDPVAELRAIMDNSLFADAGFAQIVRRDGSYVLHSQNPLHDEGSKDVFDIPAQLDPTVKQKVLEDASAGRSGYLEITVDGDTRIAAYAPSQYNDWYVMYSVPADMVNAEFRSIVHGAMSIFGIACIAFLFLILLIHRSNTKHQRKLERLAFIDPITGGRNIQKFMMDAQKVLEEAPHETYAFIYGDIKGFKYINDIFGRSTGNALLRYLWDILVAESQEGDLCARISADKFVALRRTENKAMAQKRYQEIAHNLSLFPPTAARGYKVELYGGVYMMDKRDAGLSLADMMDRALEAQQDAKRRGGGSLVGFYTNEMRAQKLWETEVESKMEQALANQEYKMFLQPKIGIQNGNRVVGMEALVRWESPGLDLLPPSRFIGLFERNGFIVHLDRYMLEEACRTYKELGLAELPLPPVLSVNVSRLSLIQSDIVQIFSDIKDKYGIPNGLIEIEFTEGLLFENHERFQDIVEQFHLHGFLCSLDDFGTGFSSLTILKSLRVDVIKLDKMFFDYSGDEERGREMVRAMIALAKFLNIKTVAEGIEEEKEVEWLREIGCDAVQGYVFSKPLPIDAFVDFLNQWKGDGTEKQAG